MNLLGNMNCSEYLAADHRQTLINSRKTVAPSSKLPSPSMSTTPSPRPAAISPTSVTSSDESCTSSTIIKPEKDFEHVESLSDSSPSKPYKGFFFTCQTPIIWRNVILMTTLHLIFLYVCLATVAGTISLRTVAVFWLYAFTSAFGILAGAHRLWSHRAYRARLPLRALLMLLQTASLQNDLLDWARNHRVHHRFSETNADPHNSQRGIFFAHIGWLLCRKHPEVRRLGATVNMDDVLSDPVVRFQRRFYRPLVFLLWLVLPVTFSMVVLEESLTTSLLVNVWRYIVSLHNTWLVNSLAHLHGTRPYNRNIEPRENKLVTYFSLGEGYHNYHHTFPWDYSASELGWRQNYNLATAFIDFFAWLGLAYDLKVPSLAAVMRRTALTGDGTAAVAAIGGSGELRYQLNHRLNPTINRRSPVRTRLERVKHLLAVLQDTLVGLLTLTVPVWSLAVGRILLKNVDFLVSSSSSVVNLDRY